MRIISHSASETKKIGIKLGRHLKAGDVVALFGELGAGKTTLVKGIARGLGVKNEAEVASPTYVLIHEYHGRVKIYHLDWYRLNGILGIDERLIEECFDPQAVTLIEWADRAPNILPKNRIEILLKHKGGDARQILIKAEDDFIRSLRGIAAGDDEAIPERRSPRPPLAGSR